MLQTLIKAVSVLLVSFFFISTAMSGEADFKIAVAAESKDSYSQISMKAARAPYFLIFDHSGKLLEKVDNHHADAHGGAGPSAAKFLAGKKVNVVIAGHFGDKMTATLKAGKIKYVKKQGVVIGAVQEQIHAK